VTGSTSGSGGTIIYQHRDTLSPRLFTDVNGNVNCEQGAYPWGESWYQTCSNFIFTTYERDSESGNDYALARSYANGQGRFLAPDPLEGVVGDPQSWNRYAYVENDPINLSDPSGQGFWEDLGIVIGEIFADVIVAIYAPEALPEVMKVEEDADVGFTVTMASGEVLKLAWSAWGAARSAAYNGEHVHQIGNGQWVPDGPDVSAGLGGMPTCTGCDESGNGPNGGAGGGDEQGPGGGGSDVAVGNDIWHESAECPNCGVIWGQSEDFVYWTMKTQVEAAALGGVLKYAGEAISALPKMRGCNWSGRPAVQLSHSIQGWGHSTKRCRRLRKDDSPRWLGSSIYLYQFVPTVQCAHQECSRSTGNGRSYSVDVCWRLALRRRQRMDSMIAWKRADAAGAERIKSRFLFTIPKKSDDKEKVGAFRDPLGLDFFRTVADQLRTSGFQVTEAKPGKACVASFAIRFPKFEVFAILLAHRPTADVVQCRVQTWCLRPLLRVVSPDLVSEEWMRVCAAIEKILRHDPNVTSLLWMTENEARVQERDAEEIRTPRTAQ
jgi:RHS repeat-associated protein